MLGYQVLFKSWSVRPALEKYLVTQSQSENNEMEKNSKKQLLQRCKTNLSISPPFSSNLWGLFILIQIIVLISSPNSLSSHCVGQKLSDILMSAPKNGPGLTHGSTWGLTGAIQGYTGAIQGDVEPLDLSTLSKNFHTAIYDP